MSLTVGARATLNFTAFSNRFYSIEWKEGLDYGRWTKLRDYAAQPANRAELFSDRLPLAEERFYRLVTPLGPNAPPGPFILRSPRSVLNNVGEPVELNVFASGTGTLTYQWRFNGSILPGATASNLVVGNADLLNSGAYAVTVTDQAGLTTNQPPALVAVRPQILVEPQSQVVAAGQSVTFAVSAVETDPLRYQWFHDGAPILGATGPSLTLVNVQAGDAASYSVAVSHPTPLGEAGTWSRVARLQVQ